MEQAWSGSVEGYVQRQLEADPNACVAIGVSKGGGVVYSKGFGYRDFWLTKPATDRTLFGVGSVTKSFTALSILLLEEEGLLSVDDPVSKYLPEYALDRGSRVLIRHLLTHTSGIPALGFAETIIDEYVRGGGRKSFRYKSEFVGWINKGSAERVCGPGEKFLYWNEGYAMLGEIVEKVAGQPYRVFVKRRVLEPLGMDRSGFGAAMLSDEDSIEPYVVEGKKKFRVAFPDHTLLDAPGGLISCVRDLLRYVAVFTFESGPFDGRLLEKMETPYIRCGLPTPLGEEYYGFGLIVNPNFFGKRLVHHGGNIGVSTAYVGFIPEAEIGVVVLSNSEKIQPSYIGALILAELLGVREEALPFVRYQRLADELCGTYQNFSRTVTLELRQVGPTLYAAFSEGGVTQSFPVVLEGEELHIVVGVEKMPIELIKDAGRVDLLVERNRFHRVA